MRNLLGGCNTLSNHVSSTGIKSWLGAARSVNAEQNVSRLQAVGALNTLGDKVLFLTAATSRKDWATSLGSGRLRPIRLEPNIIQRPKTQQDFSSHRVKRFTPRKAGTSSTDAADSEQHRLVQGFSAIEAGLLQEGRSLLRQTVIFQDGDPQTNLTRVVATSIHLDEFLSWAYTYEGPLRLQFRCDEEDRGTVYANFDPSRLHGYLSFALPQMVLRAIDKAAGENISWDHLRWGSAATMRLGDDREEAKDPDSFLAPEHPSRLLPVTVVFEAVFLNESLRTAKINTKKWTGRHSKARLALTVKVSLSTGKVLMHMFVLLIGRRGQVAIEEVNFGLDTQCVKAGLEDFQVAISLDDVFYGGEVPAQLKGQNRVYLDLFELRQEIIKHLREDGKLT